MKKKISLVISSFLLSGTLLAQEKSSPTPTQTPPESTSEEIPSPIRSKRPSVLVIYEAKKASEKRMEEIPKIVGYLSGVLEYFGEEKEKKRLQEIEKNYEEATKLFYENRYKEAQKLYEETYRKSLFLSRDLLEIYKKRTSELLKSAISSLTSTQIAYRKGFFLPAGGLTTTELIHLARQKLSLAHGEIYRAQLFEQEGRNLDAITSYRLSKRFLLSLIFDLTADPQKRKELWQKYEKDIKDSQMEDLLSSYSFFQVSSQKN